MSQQTVLESQVSRAARNVSAILRETFNVRPAPKLDFRWALLEADARAQRDGRKIFPRAPLRNIHAPALHAWRAVLPEIDERIRRFVRTTRDSIGFRWEDCADLSRHVHVWGDGREYCQSFEPRRDGLVDLVVSIVHPSEPFVPAGPMSVLTFTEQPAALIREKLDWTVLHWAASLPRRVWWPAMGFAARDVVAAFGWASRPGLAAVDALCVFESEARADLPPAVAPFGCDEDHVRFAALLKIAVAFGRNLPEGSPLRLSLEELLAAAMNDIAKEESAVVIDAYQSPLV